MHRTGDPTQFLVSDETQTFIDNVLIEETQEVTRRWHQPMPHGTTPLIQQDRPWEHIAYFTYSNYAVLRDPADGLFKCWYEDLDLLPHDHPAVVNRHSFHRSRVLYAQSEDGLTWEKPEFDIVVEDGRRTNIVLGGGEFGWVHSMSVVLDPFPSAPEYRFRGLYSYLDPEHPERQRGIRCVHSPDGIHWTLYQEWPTFGRSGRHLGDVSCLFYDPDSREFVQNTRHFLQHNAGRARGNVHGFAGTNRRRIMQCRSHDFLHWTEPMLVAAWDEAADNLDEEYYGMAQFRVGSVHLATMGLFHRVDNEMDVRLLVSRDGVRWRQTNKRQPFLAPRGEGFFDRHMVSLVSPPVVMGDELWFYHGGSQCHHDWWLWGWLHGVDHPEAHDLSLAKYALGVAKLRKDGFAGLYANAQREGRVTTHPLLVTGDRLVLNACCAPGGWIRVELRDADDNVIGPCSAASCDPVTGDATAHTVTWQGAPEIPVAPLRQSHRRLIFTLRDAELFSFTFDTAAPAVLCQVSTATGT